MDANGLPKTVTRWCRGCDLNSGPAVHTNHLATEPPKDSPQFAYDECFVDQIFYIENSQFML